MVTPAPGKATSYLNWSGQGGDGRGPIFIGIPPLIFAAMHIGNIMDVLRSLAPLIIEDPSFNLALRVTVFVASPTFVLPETLVHRRERFGKGSVTTPASH